VASFGQNDLRLPTPGQAPVAAPAVQPAPASSVPFGANDLRLSAPAQSAPLSSVFTGEGRMQYPDMPNIDQLKTPNPTPEQSMNALFDGSAFNSPSVNVPLGLLFSTDPQQKVDILRKAYPQAQFSKDSYGNDIIELDGQRVYVHKPGFRQQDVLQGVGQGIAYAKGIGGAQAALRPLTTLGKSLTTAITSALTSMGLDLGAHSAGADKVVDLPRAGITGVIGGAGEALSPVIAAGWRAIRQSGNRLTDVNGALTTEARRVLVEAGIDPAQMSDDVAREWARMAENAANPGDALRMAQANTLPVPVPQTRGVVTGDPSQQMFEELAQKGAYGEQARNIVSGVQSRAQQALRGNTEAIQARLGGGGVSRGQAGGNAQAALSEAQNRATVATDAAYGAARAAPALVNKSAMPDFARRVMEPAQTYLRQAPGAQQEAKRLAELALSQGDAVPVAQLFDWRRDVSQLMRATSDGTERAAYRQLLSSFDDNVRDLVRDGLMSGSDDAARLWQRAVNIRRGAGRRFESNDLIADLLEREYAGGGMRLKVAPEAASNYIFGAADTGFITKPQLARDLVRLRNRLGSTSAEWNGIREEAWLRFAQAAEGAFDGGTRQFSGVKFQKAWDGAWNKNPEVMRALFSPKERSLIDQFAQVATRTTNPVKGGSNPSGTGAAMANMMQRFMNAALLGEKGAAFLGRLPGFGGVYDFVQTGRIGVNAYSPVPAAQLPAGLAGGAAVVGSQGQR
jgi:hypothetical protein